VAHIVSQVEAEVVLAKVRSFLRIQPPIDQFREQLEATVGPIWAIDCAAGHYRAVGMALRRLGLSAQTARTALRAMEESAASPEMVSYTDLLQLDAVRAVLVAVDDLGRGLARVPAAPSRQHRPRKGPAKRHWYSRFVRDLTGIANELGIRVTTGGDRTDDRGA
jgi:hypothetical protein